MNHVQIAHVKMQATLKELCTKYNHQNLERSIYRHSHYVKFLKVERLLNPVNMYAKDDINRNWKRFIHNMFGVGSNVVPIDAYH